MAAILLIVSLAAGGCGMEGRARLWADTALPGGEFSTQRRQWAYDGEPVTFELEYNLGQGGYVVFGTKGEDAVVNTPKIEGRYRWTHTFHCGAKPETYEVYATPYLTRDRCDWVYDKTEEKWYYYPGSGEKPDLPMASEQVMKITCYRVEVRLGFKARGGIPKQVGLSLMTADGRRVDVLRQSVAASEARGFLLAGPDATGQCEMTYTPRFDEVSRAGRTRAELLIEHADGSVERLQQDLDTP